MSTHRSKMRLFDGRYKLEKGSLEKIFLKQLNYLYGIKSYLVTNLPIITLSSTFPGLKKAIIESIDEIKVQLLRMDEIYRLLGETCEPHLSPGIRLLTIEAYKNSRAEDMSAIESDLAIIYHLITLESIEISSFTALQQLATAMPQTELSILIRENIDMAKDSRDLYKLLAQEFVG